MKSVLELDIHQLRAIAATIQSRLYLTVDEDDQEVFDEDKDVSGADLVDVACELMRRYGLAPEGVVPVPNTETGGYEHDSLAECMEAGDHLVKCDKDGFCNACGHQDSNPS